MPRRWRFPFVRRLALRDSEFKRRPDPTGSTGWGALRLPTFRLFVFGSLLSNVGNQMRTTTVSWEVYERTGSAFSLGLIGLVMAAPVLLLALPAGVLADRFSRRVILLIAMSGLAICGGGLAIASATAAPLWCTYLLLMLTGTFRALGWPAMSAYVTQLVPPVMFANAATWRSIAFQAAAAVGPLLGGVLIAATESPPLVYAIDVVTSVVFIACLFIIKPQIQKKSRGVRSWHSLLEGVAFVRNQPIILSTITLDMVAVLFGGATALLPMYAKDVLHVDATGYGWMRAMPSLGAIVVGLWLARKSSIRRTGLTLFLSVAAFGMATIVFGASQSFALSLGALFVLGAADSVSVIIRSTLLQVLTPDELRGRVASVNAIFVNTSNEIGEFESGVAAGIFGPIIAVCGGGVMTLVTVVVVALKWPMLERLGPLDEIEPVQPPEATSVQEPGESEAAAASSPESR